MSGATVALIAYGLVVVLGFTRSRAYGVFALVLLSLPTFVGNAMRDDFASIAGVLTYLQLATAVHFSGLVLRPGMRPLWFRTLVSVPALWFVAACMVAIPWAVWGSFAEPIGSWIPFVLAAGGLYESLFTRRERVDIVLDRRAIDGLQRATAAVSRSSLSSGRAPVRNDRPLVVVQITDPHLGPFMSVARLQGICQRAVDQQPDLVLITGDLMTMESHDVDIVTAALAPLAALRGRVYACHGNHDHEARAVVAKAYATHGIVLLIDEAIDIDTPAGPVQLIGADFVWRDRQRHLVDLTTRFPRATTRDGTTPLRLWLLHDPGAFKHIPEGEADLVLAGHTHGGHVGIVSLGFTGTFLSAFTSLPDHGLWSRGRDRMYVHRANGHYGFPIRLGVPAEESVLYVWRGAA